MRTRKRRRNRYFPVMETTPLDLTSEEVLADLDPGWAGWETRAGSGVDQQTGALRPGPVDSLRQEPARGLQVA